MQELNMQELDQVSGGDLAGMAIGFFDGAATGMAIGGKWGGAGGWGFGGLAQLVGLIVPTCMGAIAGAAIGAATNAPTVVNLMSDYRNSFGPGNTANGGGLF